MAAVSTAADQTADLIKNLSLDTQIKNHDSIEVTKKPSSVQHGSVNGGEAPKAPIPSRDQSLAPQIQEMMDPNMCYLPNGYQSAGYYYGGHDGTIWGWDEFPGYMNSDGVEMSPGVYGDMYHNAYGYPPYGVYTSPGSPVPTMGHDGQLYGPQQHYQYPTTYYQPPAPPSATYTPNQAPTTKGEVSTSGGANQPPLSLDTVKAASTGNSKGSANGRSGSVPLKPSLQNPSPTSNGAYGRGAMPGVAPTSGYQVPRYGFDGMQSPVPWSDGTLFSTGQHRLATSSSLSSSVSHHSNTPSMRNQNQRHLTHLMGLNAQTQIPTSGLGSTAPNFLNKVFMNNQMYGQFGNTLRGGLGYGSNSYDSRSSARWSLVTDSKYKPRGRGNGFYGYGNENLDGFSELNRGPRAGHFKNPKAFGSNVTIAVKGQNLPSIAKEDSSVVIPDKDQYNRVEFPEEYSDAKFFIIKSYSEDDIHKSIKYSVWASTPNGNKKLDAAYHEAQAKASGCPLFLFFSVNTSGQFVGAAEMVGPVDFDKTVEYWQQDKWFGCFPVKWHIVKDIPNNILKHITLEYNENKPVTNSRDTQEVKLEHGLQMLKLFKEHVSRTSILDDFGFYDTRQKMMQEKRAKQHLFQKEASDVKTAGPVADEKEKDGITGIPLLQKSLESVSVLKNEAAHSVKTTGAVVVEKEKNGIAVMPILQKSLESVSVLKNEATHSAKTTGGVVNEKKDGISAMPILQKSLEPVSVLINEAALSVKTTGAAVNEEAKDGVSGMPILQKSFESVSVSNNGAAHSVHGDPKPSDGNIVAVDVPEVSKQATEKLILPNAAANGC